MLPLLFLYKNQWGDVSGLTDRNIIGRFYPVKVADESRDIHSACDTDDRVVRLIGTNEIIDRCHISLKKRFSAFSRLPFIQPAVFDDRNLEMLVEDLCRMSAP